MRLRGWLHSALVISVQDLWHAWVVHSVNTRAVLLRHVDRSAHKALAWRVHHERVARRRLDVGTWSFRRNGRLFMFRADGIPPRAYNGDGELVKRKRSRTRVHGTITVVGEWVGGGARKIKSVCVCPVARRPAVTPWTVCARRPLSSRTVHATLCARGFNRIFTCTRRERILRHTPACIILIYDDGGVCVCVCIGFGWSRRRRWRWQRVGWEKDVRLQYTHARTRLMYAT